jgi:FMN phosphatase YigB (HAD superfamily)
VKPTVPVSFDLFGTLLSVKREIEPANAVAHELRERGVPVPEDWSTAYSETHVSLEAGEELSLPEHVHAALGSRGVDASERTVAEAVKTAFAPEVTTRPGAAEAVTAACENGPVGICSNCAVPDLVGRALAESSLAPGAFDGIVASVERGWRKPDSRAFEAVAAELNCSVADLVHVGDDPHADGGIEAVGGRAILLTEHELSDVPAMLRER